MDKLKFASKQSINLIGNLIWVTETSIINIEEDNSSYNTYCFKVGLEKDKFKVVLYYEISENIIRPIFSNPFKEFPSSLIELRTLALETKAQASNFEKLLEVKYPEKKIERFKDIFKKNQHLE